MRGVSRCLVWAKNSPTILWNWKEEEDITIFDTYTYHHHHLPKNNGLVCLFLLPMLMWNMNTKYLPGKMYQGLCGWISPGSSQNSMGAYAVMESVVITDFISIPSKWCLRDIQHAKSATRIFKDTTDWISTPCCLLLKWTWRNTIIIVKILLIPSPLPVNCLSWQGPHITSRFIQISSLFRTITRVSIFIITLSCMSLTWQERISFKSFWVVDYCHFVKFELEQAAHPAFNPPDVCLGKQSGKLKGWARSVEVTGTTISDCTSLAALNFFDRPRFLAAIVKLHTKSTHPHQFKHHVIQWVLFVLLLCAYIPKHIHTYSPMKFNLIVAKDIFLHR